MIIQLNNKDNTIAEKIVKLQQSSYKIEAEIIGFDGIPPLKDTVDDVKRCDEIFYGFYVENVLASLISYKIDENTLDIYRVAVHPCYFKKGIATQMINYIEEINRGIKKIIVSTGLKNQPAINLYLSLGFKKVNEIEVERDFYIALFEKLK